MKKIYLLLIACIVSVVGRAQVTGTRTIGTDYTTLAAAISDLNTNGISGAVTINVPAGYTETAPSGGYVLGSTALNNSMSSTNTLTIQKSGAGSDPLLTAQIGTTTTTDGIFIIQGTDYVTINGVDVTEAASNTTATTQMEWGYALVKLNNTAPFDGCNNVVIKNCSITLNQTNTASVGIYSGTHIATSTTALTITATTDAMNNCRFEGNTITNVNRAFSLNGFTGAASPYTLYDQNNTIGGASASQGNTITNFGGTSTATYGVYVSGANNTTVRNNSITSATTPGTGAIYAVMHGLGVNSTFTVANNTVQLNASTGVVYGICNGLSGANGITGTGGVFNVIGNTFQNYNFTATNSQQNYLCVYNYAGSTSGWDLGTLNISSNIVQNMNLNATGYAYLFYNYYCNSNDVRFNNNKINGFRRTNTTSSYTYCWYNYYGYQTGGTDSAVNNKITNVSSNYYLYCFYDYTCCTQAGRNRIYMYDTVMNDTSSLGTTLGYLYSIYTYYGGNSIITNNYIANNYATPANYGGFYGIYSYYPNTQIVSNNTIKNIYTGYYTYALYTYGSLTSGQVNNNLIDGITIAPTGSTYTPYGYMMYNYAQGTFNHYNNTLKNVTLTSPGSGYIYCLYNSGGIIENFYNDTVYNVTHSTTSGGTVYGFYQGGGTTINAYNNMLGKITMAGSGGTVYGLYASSGTTVNFYQNLIDTIATTNSANTSGLAYGVWESGPTTFNCYRNKISYISAAGSGASVNGMYLNSGTTTIYNNIVGNLGLPNGSTTSGTNLVGLYLGSGTSHTLYFNTVYMNATSTAANFSSTGLYASTAPSVTLRNNVIINNSTPNGSGATVAYRRSSTTVSTYQAVSNNNLFYAGTPGTYNMIYTDGSNLLQTIAAYKTFAAPRDAASITENTTFQNTTGVGTDFLRPSTTVPTQIESGAPNIPGITDDNYGVTRAGNTGYSGTGVSPDLGAVEDNYTPNDLSAPNIAYTALPYTCGTGDRTFTAVLTDITGVNNATQKPRVYYKKNSGSWFSSAGVLTAGTTTSGTWTFTVVAADMGGLTVGDIVSYFIVAQDVVATPNIGSNPGGIAATDVNTITTYPSAPNTYSISVAMSGLYTVGGGGAYSTLTSAAIAYNTACITGPVTFSLISPSYTTATGESFPITINANPYTSATNFLTIKPATGMSPSISGSVTSSSIIKLNGADYVTIDGSNTTGGTTKNLTITNTYTSTGAAIWNASLGGAGNGADNNTIKNVTVAGGANSNSGVYGIISCNGSSIGTAGDNNANFTVQNCNIQNAYYGICLNGTATLPHTGALITQDSIGSNTASTYVLYNGLWIINQTNPTISRNTFFNMKNTALTNIAGIEMGAGINNALIERNVFTGIYQESTGGWGAYGIDMSGASCSNITIRNNIISDMRTENYSNSSTTWNAFGIRASVGVTNLKIYYNSIALSGNVPVGTSSGMSACILFTVPQTGLEIKDNILSNTQTFVGSGSYAYLIYMASGFAPNLSNYNDYSGSSSATTTYQLGYAGANVPALAGWQAVTGQDANSITTVPTFVSPSDLHLQVVGANVPLIVGNPITGITNDIDGTTRSSTTPAIGAHEVYIPPCGTVVAGTPTPVTTNLCGSGTTTINGTGVTAAMNMAYQWKSSPDNVTFTPIGGATNTSYTIAAPITATTYYKLVATCTTTGNADSASTTVNVYPVPASITGNPLTCVGATTSLASATPDGTWISGTTSVATVGSSTGVVSGIVAGTSNVTYTITSTGCSTAVVVNVSSVVPTITASATSSVICSGQSTNLSAALTTTLPGYLVTSISYAPVSFTPTGTFNGSSTPTSGTNDDGYFSVSLPFGFTFFGNTYTSGSNVYIGTNGYLTFGSGTTSTYINTMPNTSFPATIAMFARDIYLANSGTITYGTVGTAPNRQFIVSYNNVADYSTGPNETGQMVLYEGTNTIDFHITTAQSTTHTLGIQAASGTSAFTIPGQNNTSTPITNSSWRFALPAPTYTWSPATYLGSTTGNSVTASNVTAMPNITYSVTSNYNGCSYTTTKTVTVNPLPATITGTPQVCAGLTTNLATTSTGGTWGSSNTSIASVNAATGVVTGGTAGTATLSYTFTSTGCSNTQVVTVNPLPANITGVASACVGATTNLSDATPAGTWSSGTTAIATVGSIDGVVNGVSAGLAIVTYTAPTGCIKTIETTINPLPVTTITPASVATVCQGDGTSFTAYAPQPSFSILLQDFNSGLGTWTVTNYSGDPSSPWMITTTPASGATGDGTPMLESNSGFATPTETILTSPAFSTLGYGSATVSFNEFLISIATSDANVDVDYTIDNGAHWYPVNSQVGDVIGSGAWSSEAPEVSASLPAGALNQPAVKLRWHYYSNWGLYWDIDNIKVTAYQPPVTYVWNGVAGATGLSCAACGSTTITPAATGANVYSVTSTTSSGCVSTNGVTVNVNPLPSAITGTTVVCVNSTTTLADADPSGTWSSSDATVTVDLTSGAVTGVAAGTALITYTLPTGCRNTTVVTVNALPLATTGVQAVCEGLTTTLNNATGGGTWSSSFAAVADVNASGVVSGHVAGVADIYYTLTSTGCRIAATVTVNPTPQPITGSMTVCEGSTTALSDADALGTWTSSITSVATVDATSGVVTGVVAGATTITYTLPTGCINTAIMTVNPIPAVITGSLAVCQDLTTALHNSTASGTWSTTSSGASVDASGVVTGINAGVSTITYQLATTCMRTADVTVNPTPATIGGTPQVCVGLTTALNDADPSGTWTSGSTGIATVDAATGVVTGVVAGTSTITYMLPTGCINTHDVVVNSNPAAITGVKTVCEGLSTSLSDTDPGGNWSTTAFSTASVDAGGIVTAYAAGVAPITYQLPTGCINVANVTVNPLPMAIAGADQVCEGLTTALTNGTPGGSWSSGTPSVATIDASGTVYASVAGNTNITYTMGTGCISTMNVTVNPVPAAITGTQAVCEASTTTLVNTTVGGTWSTGAMTTAAVDPAGIVSGISAGTAPITYMLPTGCQATANVTVNPLPASITGTKVVCETMQTTLYNTSSGGTWTSGATGIASVGTSTGVVTGITAGNSVITYTLPTGCLTTDNVTVNPNPSAITGTQDVCVGLSTALNSASTGGTWSSSLPAVGTVTSGSGVVTGVVMGNTTITYTLPTTCKTTAVVTVNPLPAPIAGTGQICAGSVGTLTDGSAGGNWTSSTPAVATIDSAGSVNAIAAGTTLVTYTLPTGCIRTRTVVINPLPAAISGTMQVCQNANTVLTNTTPGGAWSSSAPATATINTAGVVTGANAGTATVAYTLPTGCKTTDVMTVNQIPSAIAGTPSACEGSTTALSNTVSGGAWTSSVTSVATIDGTTGVVSGLVAGTTVITYELPTGCKATRNIVINPQPAAITGASEVCQAGTSVFTNTVPGGVWSTSNTAIASVGLMSGNLNGLSAGSVDVSYTLMSGCAVAKSIVVNPLPAAITGSLNVCSGQTTAIGSATMGGTWTSSNTAIANVGTTGLVSGVAPGNAVVTYTLATSCKRSATVTVHALPAVQTVTGGGSYCEGGAGVHIGLVGSNTGINYQLYNGATASGMPVAGITGLPLDFGLITPGGTYSVVARNAATGCATDMTGSVTVTANPVMPTSVNIVTASDAVCAGVPTLFTASIVNGGTTPTYNWKVNGVTIPGATSATYTYSPANGDVVTGLVTSSATCAFPANASGSKTMTVNANEMPVASIVATPGLAVCEGSTATLNVASLYGGTSPVYTWLKNGAVAGTGSTFAYVPANGDNIAVRLNSNYTCRLADSVTSPAVTMMTSPVYVPSVTITSNYGTFVNENTNVSLTATVAAAGPAPLYQWYLNGVAVSGATSATYTKVFNNGDSVSCQVTGSGLCGMSTFNSVIMRVGPTSVATHSIGNMDVRLQPNPNKGEFTVKGNLTVKEDKEVAIEVTNMLGQVVYRTIVTARNGEVEARIKLDNNTLANGMYMLNMISGKDKKVFHFVLEQ